MQTRAVVSVVASFIALTLEIPLGKDEATTPKEIISETTMIEIYRSTSDSFNNSTDTISSDSSTLNNAQPLGPIYSKEPRKMITKIKWIPADLGLATPRQTTEVYMGAVIAMPPLSCAPGYRRQAGRCRKVYN